MSANRLLAVLLLATSLPGVARAQAPALAPAPAPAPAAAPAPAPAPEAAPPAAAPAAEPPAVPAAEPTAPPAAPQASAAPNEPDAASTDLGAELTPAELEALHLNGADPGIDTTLHVSGFMDVTAQALLSTKDAPAPALAVGDELSFFVGGLNVYLNKDLTESLRTMAEIRFTYAPNGYTSGPTGTKLFSTSMTDYAGPSETLKWGGIEIERAYLDWSPWHWLTLRIGQYLTPYGIWNVDHGSPVVIPTIRPYAVNGNFIPERQTGIEAFGRWDAFTNGTVGYHLTLSNGTGPISEYRDLDSNKAIGGRVFLEYRVLGQIQVGASGYYGRDSSAQLGLGIGSDGQLAFNKKVDSQSDNEAIAFDAQWKYEGLLIQGEWISRRVRYTEEGRGVVTTAGQLGVPPNAFAADGVDSSGYVLLGYRLPWLGIMPFGTLETQEHIVYGLDAGNTWTQLGLNIRPIGELVVKLEYVHSLDSSPLVGDLRMVMAQVAWVF